MEKGATLSFPESVISFMKGDLGQPTGGFPEELQQIILKNVKPYTDLPNAHLAPIDFAKEFTDFQQKFNKHCHFLDFLSYKFYPKVFEEYFNHHEEFGDVSYIPTKAFFYGLKSGRRN
jgi:pyruvate carboxylase